MGGIRHRQPRHSDSGSTMRLQRRPSNNALLSPRPRAPSSNASGRHPPKELLETRSARDKGPPPPPAHKVGPQLCMFISTLLTVSTKHPAVDPFPCLRKGPQESPLNALSQAPRPGPGPPPPPAATPLILPARKPCTGSPTAPRHLQPVPPVPHRRQFKAILPVPR